MTDSKALIERLQNNAVPVEPNHVIVERAKVTQIISHIEKLETENEGYRLALADQLQIRQQLEADNARLREALREMANHTTGGVGCNPVGFVKTARAALQETSHDCN